MAAVVGLDGDLNDSDPPDWHPGPPAGAGEPGGPGADRRPACVRFHGRPWSGHSGDRVADGGGDIAVKNDIAATGDRSGSVADGARAAMVSIRLAATLMQGSTAR